MDIKPIETIYNGYRFRSRLEARWAVFFDALNIKYEYEPEGFELSDGSVYLPDFFLPNFNIYVEVKPCNQIFIEHPSDTYVSFGDKDTERYGVFMNDITHKGFGAWFVFGDPIDALLAENHGAKGMNELFACCKCLLQHQHEVDDNITLCRCNGETHIISECKFGPEVFSGNVVLLFSDFVGWGAVYSAFPETVKALSIDYMLDIAKKEKTGKMQQEMEDNASKVLRACMIARQARFEHGEKPINKKGIQYATDHTRPRGRDAWSRTPDSVPIKDKKELRRISR